MRRNVPSPKRIPGEHIAQIRFMAGQADRFPQEPCLVIIHCHHRNNLIAEFCPRNKAYHSLCQLTDQRGAIPEMLEARSNQECPGRQHQRNRKQNLVHPARAVGTPHFALPRSNNMEQYGFRFSPTAIGARGIWSLACANAPD